MVQPKPGDFGLTQIPGEVGKLISLGERLNGDKFTQFSHAFIVAENNQIVEAEVSGARVSTLAEFPTATFSSWNLSAQQRDDVVKAAYAAVGTPYSFADYVAIAVHKLRLPVPGLRKYVESSKHMICSQLVDWCYQQAGVQLFSDDRWNGYVTPADLATVLTESST